MAYTHDTASDEGRLRTLIFDTSVKATPVQGTDYQFSDAEILAFLDINSDDLHASAADACRSLAAKYAAQAEEIGLGKRDIYLSYKNRSKMYAKLAEAYGNKSGGSITEFVDSVNWSIDGFGNDDSEYIGDS